MKLSKFGGKKLRYDVLVHGVVRDVLRSHTGRDEWGYGKYVTSPSNRIGETKYKYVQKCFFKNECVIDFSQKSKL